MDTEHATQSIFFPRKFTGEQAKLFAKACDHYMYLENICDAIQYYDEVPIFRLLSPEHRTFLVSRLAVGLLCEDEPLPPQTIEYGAAYAGIINAIKWEVVAELGTSPDEIGQDLIELYYKPFIEEERARREGSSNVESHEQRKMDMKLIGRVAEKNKKKLERKSDKQRKRRVNHFKIEKRSDRMASSDYLRIFEGGVCPVNTRRPPRPLTKDEKGYGCFGWRLSIDRALQEDKARYSKPSLQFMNLFPPLSHVNFCWNCFDKSKWCSAIDILMDSTYAILNSKDEALIHGEMNELAYADKAQHNRILAVEKAVQDMRDAFDPQFDRKMGAYPQRMIFAVCAEESHHGKWNYIFTSMFIEACHERGFTLKDRAGNFQRRYEVFQTVSEQVPIGLSMGFDTDFDFTNPVDYKAEDGVFFGDGCSRQGCFSWKELKLCSDCRVVKYCSRECQKKDWKNHKTMCKALAVSRKDTQKLQEVIQNF